MSDSPVHYELQDGVAVLRLDDGKVNSLSPEVVKLLGECVARAEKEASAILLVGRPGRFSAGFDLKVMTASPEAARSLVMEGAELLLQIYRSPLPVVAACTGHALAAGALLLLVSDTRVGAEGAFKIGLNEVAIGMALPQFGVELARDRLSKRHLVEAAIQGRIYDPAGAVAAGFLDRVESPEAVLDSARGEAERLAGLQRGAYDGTKQRLRAEIARGIEENLDEDLSRMGMPSGR